MHSSAYRKDNAGALRHDWPRIPLPDSLEALLTSAELGREIAGLLDTERPVTGVTQGAIRPELTVIGLVSRAGGGGLNPDAGDLDVTVGWGRSGKGGITMPGRGKLIERDYTGIERAAIEDGAAASGLSPDEAFALLGETTYDVYLNDRAYWRNVPARVWAYTIGGYQVMKKWLSYRETALLGRSLHAKEAREVTDMVRRIAAILLLEPRLDANYRTVKMATYEGWPPPLTPSPNSGRGELIAYRGWYHWLNCWMNRGKGDPDRTMVCDDSGTGRVRGSTPELDAAARLHRRNMTPAESELWQALRGHLLQGLGFRRQHPLGPFIVDFYCPQLKLVIELDGDVHANQAEYDAARTEQLAAYGYRVIRFRNEAVLGDLTSVLKQIAATVEALKDQRLA